MGFTVIQVWPMFSWCWKWWS